MVAPAAIAHAICPCHSTQGWKRRSKNTCPRIIQTLRFLRAKEVIQIPEAILRKRSKLLAMSRKRLQVTQKAEIPVGSQVELITTYSWCVTRLKHHHLLSKQAADLFKLGRT